MKEKIKEYGPIILTVIICVAIQKIVEEIRTRRMIRNRLNKFLDEVYYSK